MKVMWVLQRVQKIGREMKDDSTEPKAKEITNLLKKTGLEGIISGRANKETGTKSKDHKLFCQMSEELGKLTSSGMNTDWIN